MAAMSQRLVRTVALAAILVSPIAGQQWPHYAADQAASHYSPLDQITPANVGKLAIAWEWKPNEKILPQFGTRPGAFQNTPLMIDNVLYLSTPYNQVAALDATTRQGIVALRSESLRRRPAAERPGLRASRRRGMARPLERQARAIILNSRYR